MTHVLIADDLEENRYLLSALLQGNGYRVTAVANGVEALAAARRAPPDVIGSDALMPRMDGFALCREWMQDAALKAIPFVFYSATYTDPEDARFALLLGALRYARAGRRGRRHAAPRICPGTRHLRHHRGGA